MPTCFVTGASRGIGLALTDQFLQAGYKVLAGARNAEGARELWELESHYRGRLTILAFDVTDPKLEEHLAAHLGKDQVVDVLVNNAGVGGEFNAGLEDISLEGMAKTYAVNCIGVARSTRALLPYLSRAQAPVVAQITSKMGSIADNGMGGSYSYRMSKAALNMFNKCLALEFPAMICVTLHPGWVQTDMGGQGAPVTPAESAKGLLKLIKGLTPESTGRFYDFRGQEIPW